MDKICDLRSIGGLVAVLLFVAAPVTAQPASPASTSLPPSAADFGREPAISGLTISPDGQHIAAVTSPDGVNTVVSIWRADQPNQPPKVLSASRVNRIVGVSFAKNERVVVVIRQVIDDGTWRSHLFRAFFVDFDGKDWRSVLGGKDQNAFDPARVVDMLARDDRHVLVGSEEGIFKVDVYNGTAQRIYAAADKYGDELADLDGEIRARISVDFDDGKVYLAQWIRDPQGQWAEHFRWYAADREPKTIVGFSPDPNIVYVLSTQGRDKSAIYEYDIKEKKFLDVIFEHKLFDALGVIQSTSPSSFGEILGFTYLAEQEKVYWVDPKLAAVEKGLRQALGVKSRTAPWKDIATGATANLPTDDRFTVSITSWSADMKRFVVSKSGPGQPPEYYLLSDGGKLTKLGASRPSMNLAALGDTRLVQYPARDGLQIPAFLTTPNPERFGPGPYPSLVVPHGGPWSRDDMGWDPSGWTQYFAARGYAVLQPQYRGSEGWGQKLWRSGDGEWGQKMQDDKDDGAKWLIAQGVADPKRVAMHGYSYGGYAAMAAAVRPNGIYKCAIAGAGVADLVRFQELVGENRIGREFQKPTMEGLSPQDHAGDIKIPMLLYSGDRDVTVPIKESERFFAAAKAAGKPIKFLKLKDMGHQYNRWGPGDIEKVLEAVETYLKTDCGPGGL